MFYSKNKFDFSFIRGNFTPAEGYISDIRIDEAMG
jgi:hypothetical protein